MNTNVSRHLSSELKGLARETLLGHYSTVIGAFFLIQASLSLISFTYANFHGQDSAEDWKIQLHLKTPAA